MLFLQKLISRDGPCFIIAEIGSNHNGKISQAKKLIKLAEEVGADAVKFQSFTARGLVSKKSSSFDTVNKFQLPDRWLEELYGFSKKLGIIFLCTPFEEKKADLLNKIGVPAFKIASGDLAHTPLLKHIAKFNKPIILSTGASYLKEVEKAVKVIKNMGNKNIILLHCVSNYPAKLEDFNLRAMLTLKNKFNLPVGISDHTLGITIPIASVALGAKVIEKHITLSRRLEGPDHFFAMIPSEFKTMVDEIRKLEKAQGNGIKRPIKYEFRERLGARRSIHASCDISPGEIITQNKIKIVRPACGIAPEKINSILGKIAKCKIKEDEAIKFEYLK